jgi:excisionase family DNA binding protein
MKLRKDRKEEGERVLDVDASMQGTLTFKDAVNLRISGGFEGNLNTKGNLMIGEAASVDADIVGESIIIAGKVKGNVVALKELKLISPAVVIGDIRTPLLSVAEGAVLDGRCIMLSKERREEAAAKNASMSAEDLAKYLEVDTSLVYDWANSGKLPGTRDGSSWRFDRRRVEEWVAAEKIK